METEVKNDPTTTMFEEWLASKFANHKAMDPFTKSVLRDFWKKNDSHVGIINDGISDLEKANNDEEQEIEDYMNEFDEELEEPWGEDGVPYEIDHEWYNNLMDGSLKDEALEEKSICEKSWGNASQSIIKFYAWLKRTFRNFYELDYELLVKLEDYWWKVNNHGCSLFANWRDHIRGPYANFFATHDPYLDINRIFNMDGNASYINNVHNGNEQDDEERHELCDDATQELPVCRIKRYMMIKYSFEGDENYVAIKEDEYDDLTSTSEEACRAYQEIFRIMDEGWMVTRDE
ncbi:hypothetical protein Tco_0708097 [Tanacetum coccineum]